MQANLSASERAYGRLKADILGGVLPVGPLDIGRLADRLRMSVTPVREALARLGAERIVKRSVHGYVISLPSPRRLENLYQISGVLLDLTVDSARRSCGEPCAPAVRFEVAYAERMTALLHEIASGQANRELAAYAIDISDRLFPARRSEAVVFAGAMQDLETLTTQWDGHDLDGLRISLRAYHDARIDHVDALARHLAAQAGDP